MDSPLPPEFASTECLSISQVEALMAIRQRQIQESGEEVVNPVFEKTFAYVQRFSKFKNKESVRQVNALLSNAELNLSEYEKAMLANLLPTEADEAVTLIPSLNRFSKDTIETLVAELQGYSRF